MTGLTSRRAAHLAGLHAAQALIVDRTGKVIRRYRGVQRELGRLTKDEPHFDQELTLSWPRLQSQKAIADYETGPCSRVSIESARAAIDMARRFVESITGCLLEARRLAGLSYTTERCRP